MERFIAKKNSRIYQTSVKHNIPLFMDGARLGYGLMSNETDVTIEDIANYCDIFILVVQRLVHYVVKRLYSQIIMNLHISLHVLNSMVPYLLRTFSWYSILELFTDNLYFEISRHAINMANKMKQGFIDKGYKVYFDSPTNQQFFVLSDDKIKDLQSKVKFAIWEKYDDTHRVVRFATSWATTEENIDKLLELI